MTTSRKIEKLKEIIDVLNMALEVLEEKEAKPKKNNQKPIWDEKDWVDPRL